MHRRLAEIISYLFHPLFLVTYMLFLLMAVNPYLFSNREEKVNGLIIISVVMTSVVFPVVSISLMKALNLIDSFQMEDRKERVGPLIAAILFYMWLFLNVKSNSIVPKPLVCFILGTVIAMSIGFVVNNFTKISLHVMGAGGFFTGLLFMRTDFFYDSFIVNTSVGQFIINSNLLIIIAIIIAGLVGTARLSKEAHTSKQLYIGAVIGIISQWLGFNVI